MEESPHHFFAFALIGDFLFAQSKDEVSGRFHARYHTLTPSHPHTLTPSQFSTYVDQLPYFQRLLVEPDSFWVAIVTKYFVQAPHVTVSLG